ncbi:beta-ketoacyl-ACP synthase III [Roseococcus pinisoli]|uniref:Beta-ketoacyl-[acyl-carrier-protein] synthase III n=1 Tax=Roseococcus pinisoli TaxID=2835040 RepID=A0ABS5QI23_9PROT|nr:beta-ketoacyl-ACP synthase III [Roseococcus pinisoli]MBS7813148.1 ketoacyl-ACP synthase III [Roseococcus pinisoli]
MSLRSVIAGCGGHLPSNVLDNAALAAKFGLDTSDEWIRERSGICQRHLAGPDDTATSLGAEAARRALAQAGIDPSEVDGIICATSTPDNAFPSTGAHIQAALGVKKGFAFDVSAACTGFIYALSVGDAMIRAGQARCVLVIGAEVYSRILDWSDRSTCVLFGDGAGAVVLRAEDEPGDRGVLSTHLHADGSQAGILYVEGTTGPLKMAGNLVFRQAVNKLSAVVDEALAANKVEKADVKWLVPHQANIRIIDAMGRKLGLSPDRVVKTVDRHANTSAASVPLALAEAVGDGRIRPGDLVLLEAIGGGLTWGAALVRF